MVERFRIEGLKELDEALKELPKATARNVLLRVAKAEAEPIRDTAEALAPDRPGPSSKDLKNSIKVLAIPARQRESSVEVGIGPIKQIFYGRYQEFGTAHHGPHPFMRPAFDNNVQRVLNGIKKSLADEIEKARKRLARKAERLAAKMRT